MKVLFLDFDGVLNSWENQNIRNALSQIDNSVQSKDVYGYYFDEKCVRYLQYILAKTNAKIVVTSFWRWRGKDTIQLMWKERIFLVRFMIQLNLTKAQKREIASKIG